ncbi:uncharacterized protein LOC127720461 isoform X2 [Mytilus californianus]|uniref:uncharacterized protein LOC127720461 isoform X2 n=1 Tax=Mytilus californianus TaxID=6549 RepID=UPI0022464413|nr:uncharacterized protein LOC127720461 isoform X2 [Mytilus californianus]
MSSTERQAVLGSFVIRLFPQVMQGILKEYITSRGLTEKYKQKDIRAVLTVSEIALMDKLPNMVDFTIELCYKILRYEHLLPEPKCKWGNVPSDEDVEIIDDIQRILNGTNEIIRMKSDDISEDYYEEVCTTTHDVLKRVDKFLNLNTCVELYHAICQSKLNPTDIVSKLREVKQVNVTHNVHEVDENKERYSRISLVVIESFPNMLRNVIRSIKTAREMYNLCTPFLRYFTSDQQTKLQELQSSNSYDSLDISMIYRLLKQFSLISRPTKNWGDVPDENDITLADDVERIRYFRNKIAHMCSTNIEKVEFDNYFNQFLDIGRRMDKITIRRFGENFQNTNFESEIIGHKTCNMDIQMQIKYKNALKELENIKLRFEKKPIKFFWGESFQRSLMNLRSLLQEEKLEGRKKIRIQIIFENQSDGEKNKNILNALKDEVNEGLSGIEFISATKGSLILNVDVLLEMMATDEFLQSTISSFVEKISELITLSTTESIDITLSHTEENIVTKEESFTQAQTAIGDNIHVSATLRKHVDIKSKENTSQNIKDCIKIGNMLLFTEDSENQLIIYNADGTLERTFHLDYKPWYLAEINRNTVAVSCPSAKTVLIINIYTGSVSDKIKLEKYCFGISYNDYLYVVVEFESLYVMDLAGEVIRTIDLVHICHITVHKNMLVYIDNTSISCLSLDGKVIWKFENDKYKRLRRVTTDDEGNVYVTNEDTNVVLVVSKDGQLKKEILTESDGMDMPAGIHFDKKENILMICSDRDAWLFDVIKNKK